MQPKKPIKDMWSNGQAMLIQHKMTKKSRKQIVPQEDEINCQEILIRDQRSLKSMLTRNVKLTKTVKKPINNM